MDSRSVHSHRINGLKGFCPFIYLQGFVAERKFLCITQNPMGDPSWQVLVKRVFCTSVRLLIENNIWTSFRLKKKSTHSTMCTEDDVLVTASKWLFYSFALFFKKQYNNQLYFLLNSICGIRLSGPTKTPCWELSFYFLFLFFKIFIGA